MLMQIRTLNDGMMTPAFNHPARPTEANTLTARALRVGSDRCSLALSRPIATADSLGDLAPDRHRFVQKRVLLSGDPTTLATANGRVMLLSALRLLVRICPNVVVRLAGATA